MKILIYFPGKLFAPKGTPIRVQNMISQLRKNGFEIFYAGHDTPEGCTPDHVLTLARPLKRLFQLTSFVKRNNIDIVYFQAIGVEFAPWLWLTTGARLGMDFHSRRYQEERVYQGYSKAKTALYEWLELFASRFLTFGTGVSHTLATYYGRAVSRFLVLPVGVDTTLFSPVIEPRADIIARKGSSILIGYAGNTKWYQGLGTVLEAFAGYAATHPGVFTLLMITSSANAELHAFAKEKGLEDSILILDKQPHEEIPAILAAADILTVVRPSDRVTEYSFPSKLPEYAALGKALVVSAVSDIGSYITDDENGMIVPPSDVRALEGAFRALEDSSLRKKLGENARALAVQKFDLEKLGGTLRDFLVSLA